LYLLYLNIIINNQYIEKPARATKTMRLEGIEQKKKKQNGEKIGGEL
jgi:hypothetical protein